MKYSILFFTLFVVYSTSNIAQEKISSSGVPEISAGGEYNLMLQKAIREGKIDFFKTTVNKKFDQPPSVTTISPFDGPNFDTNPTYNGGFRYIPPDPIAAAGTDRVISVVNCLIECRNKTTGAQNWIDDLKGFFTSLSPATATFDPKVIYDQYENRFVVVTLEAVNAGTNPNAGNTSKIFLAVSKTSTPATATSADWYYTSINAKQTIGGFDHFADFPGFAIDEEAVYVCTNMFAHTGGSTTFQNRLWIVDKGVSSGFYGGGTATVSSAINFITASGASFYGTHQPAHVFGSGGVPSSGTFLVMYDGLTYGGATGVEALQVIRINNPLGIRTYNVQYVNLSNLEDIGTPYGFPDLPDAPQSGSATGIEVNDRRTLNAVWRNNNLYVTTTINPRTGTDAGQTTAHWVRINTATLSSLSLADEGNVGGENIATGTYTFFPSLAVNSGGDMIVGFAACASTIYAGAYYAGRFSGDAAGTLNPSVVVMAGLDTYVRTFGGSRNRWGDYTGACVDPSDDQSFWIFNEYAMARGSGTAPDDGRWATAYVKVPIGEVPVELSSFSASAKGSKVELNWRTETETQNYGFEIERKYESKTHSNDNVSNIDFEKIVFIEGNGNSNSPKEYTFLDNSVKSGKYFYRLKQIDSDGSINYSNIIEVNLDAPKQFELSQNFPNPFNPVTTINYSLASAENIELKIFNLLGEEINTLAKGFKEAGSYSINFDAGNLESGIYFYKIEAGSFVQTKKMILLK